MWLTIIVAVVLGYYIYNLEKRIKSLEEVRGPGYSHWFMVNALKAVMNHKKFGEITKIKSAQEGKDFKDWSKADKDRWYKISDRIATKSHVKFSYLPGENAYFVNTGKETPYLTHRSGTNNLLYSEIIVGDVDGFKDHITLDIYERLRKGAQGKYEWYLTVCLDYKDEKFFGGKKDFQILCEFPHFRESVEDDELKQLGFEIKRQGGDDIYEDSFGENHAIPTVVEYIKNGVEIRYVY